MPIGQPAPPPKRGTVAKTPKPAVQTRKQARAEALTGWAQIGSFVCLCKGWLADSQAIAEHAPPICDEIAQIGETNEQLAGPLDALCKAGPYAALMASVMPLALQLAANHGKVQPGALGGFGVVAPATLEARAKAEMAKTAAHALQVQQEAEEQLRQAQAQVVNAGV